MNVCFKFESKFIEMKKIFFVLIISLSSALSVKAQAALGITPFGIFISNGSVHYGDSINFYFRIQNKGTEPYSGQIVIDYLINDSLSGELDSLTTNFLIPAGDSVSVYVENWIVTSDLCSVGDNIVVIWPVALEPNVPTTDSASVHFNVLDNVGIEENHLNEDIKVYYDPVAENLIFDYGEFKNHVAKIELFNLYGTELVSYIVQRDQISLINYNSQLYFLKIILNDGRSVTFKIIKLR